MCPINLDNDAGADKADRIPDGKCVADVTRIFTRSQGGGPLKTKAGDRKIKLVVSDSQGRECWYDAMVEGKGLFTLARLLKHIGYSSEDLDAQGIGEYTDFLDQKTAERFMLNKRVRLEVSTNEKGYPKLETLPQEDANGKAQKPAARTPKAETVAPRPDLPF